MAVREWVVYFIFYFIYQKISKGTVDKFRIARNKLTDCSQANVFTHLAFQLAGDQGSDIKQIGDRIVVALFQDGRVWIGIYGDNHARGFHPGEMLVGAPGKNMLNLDLASICNCLSIIVGWRLFLFFKIDLLK